MTGEPSNAMYQFQLYSLVLFAYALVLKILLIGSVVVFDCRGVEQFWIESGLFGAFVAVLALMLILAALPSSQRSTNPGERRWSLVATGFTLYVGAWLLLLFAFLRPESLVGNALAVGFGFERGNWCS